MKSGFERIMSNVWVFYVGFLIFGCLGIDGAGVEIRDVRVRVGINRSVAVTDEQYVCVTLDYGPPEKCDATHPCSVPQTSVLNLDLKNPILVKAVGAFGNLRIRVGGSLQDSVYYDVGKLPFPCPSFKREPGGFFGYSHGCLHMDRWDDLNHFFNLTGAMVTFSLNALNGRTKGANGYWTGAWNSTNARDLINYTVSTGFKIDSWEFGNELSGKGIGASVGAKQYAKDVIKLRNILLELYNGSTYMPLLLAPGGFYDKEWYSQLLQHTGPGVVNGITHHIYNLGPSDDPSLMKKVLDPSYLNGIANTFLSLDVTLQISGPWAAAWIGEAGGVYHGGQPGFSDTFVNSFWYLDQLGMAAVYNTKVYCRQDLVGSNYSLLNVRSFTPNPDYYSALLWNRLMGPRVLSTSVVASGLLRAYTHCSRNMAGITMLLINLSPKTTFRIHMEPNNGTMRRLVENESFAHRVKNAFTWVGKPATDVTMEAFSWYAQVGGGPKNILVGTNITMREEYHLIPENSNLRSHIMLLNGKPLLLTKDGDIPALEPLFVDTNSSLLIRPLSIVFVSLPYFSAPACT